MTAAATMAVRKSVRLGPVATSPFMSAARCIAAAAAATPNLNVSCWTTFARVFAALICSGDTSANVSELRALNCTERVSPLANRTITITA